MKKLILLSIMVSFLCSNDIENTFLENKLINVHKYEKSIIVDLVNSNKSNNIFAENFYNSLNKCYLQKEVALKLKKAQKILKDKYPRYSIIMMDCTRPRSVSWKMYNKLKNTPFEKYVANPVKGSMHNFGAAVDVAIVDENNKLLDFGINPFYKGKIKLGYEYIKHKILPKLTNEQIKNRKLLKDIMEKADFRSIKLEWWHFNGFSKNTIRKKYKIIE